MSKRTDLSDDDVVLLAQAVSILDRRRKLWKNVEPSAVDHTDFLFGGRSQTRSEYGLRSWSDVLGGEYSFHIERLLSEIGYLRIHGSTSTGVRFRLLLCVEQVPITFQASVPQRVAVVTEDSQNLL